MKGNGPACDDSSHVFVGGGLDSVVDCIATFREGFLDLADFFGVVDLFDGLPFAVDYSEERRGEEQGEVVFALGFLGD